MSRWMIALWLVACGSTSHPPSNVRSDPSRPALGVFMTPSAPHDDENQLYVSAWQERGQTVLGLLCRGPCLPNVLRRYRYKPDSYRSESVRQIAPLVWEGTMRAEVPKPDSIKPATFTMRLDLSTKPPTVSFGGRERELRTATLHKTAYQFMGEYGERKPMLFVNTDSRELLIKPAPPPDGRLDDTFLYLAPDASKVHTVHARNWRFRFAPPKANPELVGAHFAVLHGELLLPQGEATVELDEIRTPANDVSMGLTRAGKTVRFHQTNDSNTHQYEHCAAGKCELLLTAADVTSKCPDTDRIAIWFDPAGTWRWFGLDGKDNLLDSQCKITYGYKYVDETKVILTEPNGQAIEFTQRPDPPQ